MCIKPIIPHTRYEGYPIICKTTINNKCSDKSMDVKLPALLEKHERQTNRQTDQQNNRPTVQPTDGQTGS